MHTETHNIALFIDLENFGKEATEFDPTMLVNKLKERGRIVIKRAYADWGRFARLRHPMMENSIDMIELPSHSQRFKNSADIRLVVDAMEVAFSRDHIDMMVVVSGDSDFIPLISKLREYNKHVIVVGHKDGVSKLLQGSCDELIYYSSLIGRPEVEQADLRQAYDLLRRVVEHLESEELPARGSLVKSYMKQFDASFDEENIGFSRFRLFLERAARDNIIQLGRLEHGELEVKLKSNQAPGNDVATATRAAPKEVARLVESGHPMPVRETAPRETRPVEAWPPKEVARSEPARADAFTNVAPPKPTPAPVTKHSPNYLVVPELRALLHWSLKAGTTRSEKRTSISDLANLMKGLEPNFEPGRYGYSKSRGFKGILVDAKKDDLVDMVYREAENVYLIEARSSLTGPYESVSTPFRFAAQRYKYWLGRMGLITDCILLMQAAAAIGMELEKSPATRRLFSSMSLEDYLRASLADRGVNAAASQCRRVADVIRRCAVMRDEAGRPWGRDSDGFVPVAIDTPAIVQMRYLEICRSELELCLGEPVQEEALREAANAQGVIEEKAQAVSELMDLVSESVHRESVSEATTGSEHKSVSSAVEEFLAHIQNHHMQLVNGTLQEEVLKTIHDLMLLEGRAMTRNEVVSCAMEGSLRKWIVSGELTKSAIMSILQILISAHCFEPIPSGDSLIVQYELRETYKLYDALRAAHDVYLMREASLRHIQLPAQSWAELLYESMDAIPIVELRLVQARAELMLEDADLSHQ